MATRTLRQKLDDLLVRRLDDADVIHSEDDVILTQPRALRDTPCKRGENRFVKAEAKSRLRRTNMRRDVNTRMRKTSTCTFNIT